LTVIGREPLPPAVTDDNLHYLTTKRDRMGHELPGLGQPSPAGEGLV
jgi:3,4-dihydroxy 2-butanone 4-phosphate synthase/GTP cyclohydrolase II